MKKRNDELINALQREIDVRSSAMWEQIKKLPETEFSTTSEQLDAVIAVGLEAAAIQQLRKTMCLV